MISGEKIGKYIAEPFLIEASDLPDLLELTKKYPYCSSLQLLHLKGLALSNDLSFEDQLKVAAIHAPDREHLYALIHSGEVLEEVSPETETEVKTETIAEESAPVEETISEVSTEIEEIAVEKEVVETPEETAEEIETEEIVESAEISEPIEITAEPTLSSEEEPETEPVVPATDELEVDILNKAIDIAFVESEISEDVKADSQEEIEAPVQEEPEEEAVEAKTEPLINAEPVEVELGEEEIEISEQPQEELSFIQWLRLKQGRNNDTEKEDEPIEIASVEDEVPRVEEKIEPEKKTEKNDIDALLDKFIAEEPTISRPVKDFYNPVKNARESVQESDDLVTETLAKIHVMQKNYSKAISAYEKLILLYPEKKAFFASQIEKIEEEIKKR